MKLSMCIATFNRGRFIGATLDSILGQLEPGVEIIIVDGASQDETEAIVSSYAARYPAIRYIRETINSGIDEDYDKAVGYASGKHCWLVADDDLIAPAAIARVIEALEDGAVDVLVVDAEVRDVTLATVLDPCRLPFSGERRYGPADGDAFLRDAGNGLSFIGCTIVRRNLWMERQRSPYFGSLFIHVGVIFQAPARLAKALGEPLVIIRLGNAMWTARSFEIWMFKWPSLIWGFDGYSQAAKAQVTRRRPWRSFKQLFAFRANGAYTLTEYRRFFQNERLGWYRMVLLAVALLPGKAANLIGLLYLLARGHGGGAGGYNLVACSRYASRASRALMRASASRSGACAWAADR